MELQFPTDNDFFPDMIRFISEGHTWNYNVFWSLPNWPVNPPPQSAGFIWDLPFWRLGDQITPEHRAYCESVGIPILNDGAKYALYERTASKFDIVFTASRQQADIIYAYWGIRPIVIKMPYRETEIAWAKASPVYHTRPLWADRPYVIQVGRNDWHKGFGRSIDYFNKSSIHETHDLVFVFPAGPMVRSEHDLHDLCDKATKLRIFHQLPYHEVIRYIHHADLLLSPTAFEGMNQPPFEAAMVETFSVISDLPVHHEYWENEGMPLFCSLESFILWELALSEEIKFMKQPGFYNGWSGLQQNISGNYSFAAYADRLCEAGIVGKKEVKRGLVCDATMP